MNQPKEYDLRDYLNEINKELIVLYKEKANPTNDNSKKADLTMQIYQLEGERARLEAQIIKSERQAAASDGEIDLYEKNFPFSYKIYLSGTDVCIGEIDYREGNWEYLGNVGYSIHPEYRGNNYSMKAFKLLNSIICSRTPSVMVTVKKDNIASNRILQKMGGTIINSDTDEVVKYQIITSPVKEQKK